MPTQRQTLLAILLAGILIGAAGIVGLVTSDRGLRHGWYDRWIVIGWLGFGVALVSFLVWKFQRFSLRTLLIAMTLVAVVLGTIIWLSR